MRSKKLSGFTLVELLVVVGIIAVLISLLLPSLNKARQAARATVCLSNIRQCATALRLYSVENNDWIIVSRTVKSGSDFNGQTAGNHVSWSRFVSKGRSVYGDPGYPTYLKSMQALLCPQQNFYTEHLKQAANKTLGEAIAYGIYSPTYAELTPRRFNNFIPVTWNSGGWWEVGKVMNYSTGSLLVKCYRLSAFRQPTRTMLLADVIEGYTDHKQSPEFAGRGLSFNVGGIHLVHNSKANVAFMDGHAEAMTAKQMRYETTTAPNYFYAQNPGPGTWDDTVLFSSSYPNTKYPQH